MVQLVPMIVPEITKAHAEQASRSCPSAHFLPGSPAL